MTIAFHYTTSKRDSSTQVEDGARWQSTKQRLDQAFVEKYLWETVIFGSVVQLFQVAASLAAVSSYRYVGDSSTILAKN